MVHSMHTKPIPSVDQWRAPLRLFDKVSKEMGLWIVESFHAALGHDAAIVCLRVLYQYS